MPARLSSSNFGRLKRTLRYISSPKEYTNTWLVQSRRLAHFSCLRQLPCQRRFRTNHAHGVLPIPNSPASHESLVARIQGFFCHSCVAPYVWILMCQMSCESLDDFTTPHGHRRPGRGGVASPGPPGPSVLFNRARAARSSVANWLNARVESLYASTLRG